jgi:SAM-dependent methyltransferase
VKSYVNPGDLIVKSIYENGTYLTNNPTWHSEDSAWKAANIIEMMNKHHLSFHSFAEVGCGAGGIISRISERHRNAIFHGYDISPQAIALAKNFESENLKFFCTDIFECNAAYDVTAIIDVIEHVEDYITFLKRLRDISKTFLFVIPLDINVSRVLRNIMKDDSGGHLHFFMKDTAISILKHAGYEIVDWCYTPGGLERAKKLRHKITWLPRKILYSIHKDFCVRLLDGFPLLVLARR